MENSYNATGKRKCAIARVILKPGKGERTINGNTMKEYLKSDTLIRGVEQPLELLKTGTMFDVFAHIQGGGPSGQAGALRLGISRALAQINEDYHKALRKNGFLTRDSRVVERKKYGQSGARRRFQFSKR